jgi:hypothetical protein
MRKKAKGINPALEQAISQLLAEVMADPTATLTDKSKVLDRALKLEAIKQKADFDDWGAAFADDEEDEK